MLSRNVIGAIASAAVLLTTPMAAWAFDESKYPDWKGAWSRIGNPRWDTSKPPLAQQPPLTPEYQAIYEANLRDVATGGQGTDPTYTCLAPYLHRRARLARGDRAFLCRLFHRPVGRCGRGWPLRRARSRDPPHERP